MSKDLINSLEEVRDDEKNEYYKEKLSHIQYRDMTKGIDYAVLWEVVEAVKKTKRENDKNALE